MGTKISDLTLASESELVTALIPLVVDPTGTPASKVTDVQAAVTKASGWTADGSGGASIAGPVVMAADQAVYIGSPTTDGSWRFIRSGDNLAKQRRESGIWVTKSEDVP